MARQRRFNACLTAAAIALAVAQALVGGVDLLLAASPLLLLTGLLLCGRYLGEERIVARLVRRLPAPARRRAVRWRPAAERPLASLLARTSRLERGPPAAAPVTAAA